MSVDEVMKAGFVAVVGFAAAWGATRAVVKTMVLELRELKTLVQGLLISNARSDERYLALSERVARIEIANMSSAQKKE